MITGSLVDDGLDLKISGILVDDVGVASPVLRLFQQL